MKMNLSRQLITIVICVALSLTLLVALVSAGDLPQENRKGIARDLTTLALRAQDYYRRGLWEGGGGGSFEGLWSIGKLTAKPITPNGVLAIRTVYQSALVLIGTGTQRGADGNQIEVTMIVFPDSMYVMFVN